MQTTEIPFEPSRHPIIAARLAKHLVYDQAALVAESIGKWSTYRPAWAGDWSRGFSDGEYLEFSPAPDGTARGRHPINGVSMAFYDGDPLSYAASL